MKSPLKIQFWNERIQGFLENLTHGTKSILNIALRIVGLVQNNYKNRAFYFLVTNAYIE